MDEANLESDSLLKTKTGKEAAVVSHHLRAGLSPLAKLTIAAVLCSVFMCGEVVGGLVANSIAILTDAAHLFSDLLGFGFSIVAILIARRPASQRTSFGYHRSEVIGAISSLLVLWVLTAWLVFQAVERFVTPEDVDGKVMLVTSVAGLLVNIVICTMLHTHSHEHAEDSGACHAADSLSSTSNTSDILDSNETEKEYSQVHDTKNINVKAAIVHVLGDLIQSTGVVIASILVCIKPEWRDADPVCTVFFAILVLCTSVPVMGECLNILMERTPAELDADKIATDLKTIPGVRDIHDLHVWLLSPGKPSFSCHIESDNPHLTLVQASRLLKKKFGITHTTIQVELVSESLDKLDCTSNLHQIHLSRLDI